MKKIFLTVLLPLAGYFTAFSQTSFDEIRECPEKAGGVYYAYPITTSSNTLPPNGYEPFYISHYGRHGSRYLISDNDYSSVRDILKRASDANALSPLGLSVLARLDSVWTEAEGRGGELSPLGNKQHHDIADRMFKAFPQVFSDDAEITASSTVIMRCAHSMFSFIEGLKENNPSLIIPRESSQRRMDVLNYHSKESEKFIDDNSQAHHVWKKFKNSQTHPDRLVNSIFSDPEYVQNWIDPEELMWQLYWIAVGQQNIETEVSFMDIFTPEELYDLWQSFNFHFFSRNSSYLPANGHFTANARNLVNDIIVNADKYISENKNGATLRFGHDGNIVPLTALLRLENCYSNEIDPTRLADSWTDFKVSPMAANLQIVFFKNNSDDIIVKFMLNEREIAIDAPANNFPFYSWAVVRPYLQSLITD